MIRLMHAHRPSPLRRWWMICAVLLLSGGLAQSALAQDSDPLGDLPDVEVVLPTLPPVVPTTPPVEIVPTLPPPADVPVEVVPTLPPATVPSVPTLPPELPSAPTLAPAETVPPPSPTVLAPASIFLTPDTNGEGEAGVLSLTLSAVSLADAQQLTIICQVDPGRLRAVGLEAGDLLSFDGVAVTDYGFQSDGSWMLDASYPGAEGGWQGGGIFGALRYEVLAAGAVDITCLFQLTDGQGQPQLLTTPAISLSIDTFPASAPPAEDHRMPAEMPQSDPLPTEMPTPTATIEAPVSVGYVTGMLAPPLPLAEMTVIVAGAEVYVVAIGADGSFAIDLPYGSYELVATISGYPPLMRELVVDAPVLALPPLTDADFGSFAPPVDVNMIIEHFGQPVPPAPPAADVNGDGRVDIYDLVRAGRGAGS